MDSPIEQTTPSASGSFRLRSDITLADFENRQQDFLPGHLGFRCLSCTPGRFEAALEIQPFMLAPNGYLHAATLIALADTAAGYGTIMHLPDRATGFTTIELKSNFLSTATHGMLNCTATLVHGGRSTQLWDALVVGPDGRTLALFRCTQMILYPK